MPQRNGLGGLGTYYGGPITEPVGDEGALTGQDVADLLSGASGGVFAPPESAAPRAPDGSLNPFLIPDAFAYNVRLKYLPYRGFPMLLRLLDDYRRQSLNGVWSPRYYVVPQSDLVIAPGDQFYEEVRTARGAILWGFSFATAPIDFVSVMRVSILDVCSQYEITAGARSNKFVRAQAFRANLTSGSPSSGYPFVLMAEPYRVAGDGLLACTIVNMSAAARSAQLLLLCLEPRGSQR